MKPKADSFRVSRILTSTESVWEVCEKTFFFPREHNTIIEIDIYLVGKIPMVIQRLSYVELYKETLSC